MMRFPNAKGILPLYMIVFILSLIIIFGIIEFRFLKNILGSYGNSIEQIAVNKTNFFLSELTAISENAARRVQLQNMNVDEAAVMIADSDKRITNIYITDSDGIIRSTFSNHNNIHMQDISRFAQRATEIKGDHKLISEVNIDPFSQLQIIRIAVPMRESSILVIDYKMDQYQREMIEEFTNTHYKIAVFDSNNNPVIWPFDEESLGNFDFQQSSLYVKNDQYHLVSDIISLPPLQLYIFQKENNFETVRAITIIFLVSALYYCLYQLLVELWGVNSAKTYFDNIDFAILNQTNEGVIITNNAGIIIFANKAAHEIFAERKSVLSNVKLNEIMGHIEDFHEEKDITRSLTLKTSDKLLEAVHSPIIKKGKKLGSLTVIRVNSEKEKALGSVLYKLIEIIPEGIIYVDKNNEIVTANLMAKFYLGNLDKGKNIRVISPSLADFIYKNIDLRTVNRMELKSHGIWCDIAPVYDDDEIYSGTLVMLLSNDKKDD